MKKKIILFGYGIRGKNFLNCFLEQGGNFEIEAIADNKKAGQVFAGIPVIKPEHIKEYKYDEIWLCTKSYNKDIRSQLIHSYGIENKKIIEMDSPAHIYLLDERIREKYQGELNGTTFCDDPEKLEVINYLRHHKARMYCYSYFEEYMKKDPPIFRDEISGLFYTLYLSKKMYFARRIDSVEKAKNYFNFITMEQDVLSPHKYLTDKYIINDNDVGIDIGAAEGIFTLEVIDKAGFVYLLEADEEWLEALQLTFREYKDKVQIIKAFVSDSDNGECITVDALLQDKKIDFIKMDIEGEECNALKGAEKTLKAQNVKLAVCAYHHPNDYVQICRRLMELGYKTYPSKGYLICTGEWEKNNRDIDFRKAIVFAHKEGG